MQFGLKSIVASFGGKFASPTPIILVHMDEVLRSLEDVRSDIDAIDSQLVSLLNRRTELAQEIGRVKGDAGQPFFTPEREHAIYRRLRDHAGGPLAPEQLEAVFREIISASRAAEQTLKIGFWGPEGTFSHSASLQTFGRAAHYIPYDSISEVFDAVERRELHYGVVPVENSAAGIVPETLDAFPQTRVKICAENYIPIAHHLAGHAKDLSAIKKVYAGPQPAAQCKRWLRANVPNAMIVDAAPTARAAEYAAGQSDSAAIVNRLCAELRNLPYLAENIEDEPNNRTRFLVIGFNEPKRTGQDKTSLMFSLRNEPGELYHALGAFMDVAVNLTMIESRPTPRTRSAYTFFVDADGHSTDDAVQKAMKSLRERALDVTVLGSYPAAPGAR